MPRIFVWLVAALAGLLVVGPATAGAATERARIIWNQANDLDLHVYDAAGNHASFEAPAAIPQALLSEDVTNAGGPETFTDNQEPSTRPFGYQVCYYAGDETGAGRTDVTLTLTAADGTESTQTFTLGRPGNCYRAGAMDLIPPDVDGDADTVFDESDNCPGDANPDQTDTDGDGLGDVCDTTTDADGDGVLDGVDNCPGVANAGQQDTDDNGVGDACEITDSDADGVPDNVDNCPSAANPGQGDADDDGIGDACEAAPPTPTPTVVPTLLPPPVTEVAQSPQPELGKTVVAGKVGKGTVRIRLKNGKFRTLGANEEIPLGSEIDATKGRVRLTSASGPGGATQTADFYKGAFRVTQTRGNKPITQLALSARLSCGKKGSKAQASAKKKKVRRLWGDGKGSFRTRGRNAAATVRGTKWLTEDRCDSTKVTVKRGKVLVRDFLKRKNFLIKKGHSYVARKKK